jgi:hypothetical protein
MRSSTMKPSSKTTTRNNLRVCSVLDSRFHRQGLVSGSLIFVIRRVIQNTWPKQCPASLWHDSDIQLVKIRPTTRLHIVEVQVHREKSSTRLTPDMMRYTDKRNVRCTISITSDTNWNDILIVVCGVELARLIS